MTRAKEKAIDAWAIYEYRKHPKGLYHTCFVDGYKEGYEQAEKDILKIISQITADLWGAPCNYSPLDEETCLCPNTHCDEICGTPEASDARCWEMYFNLKIEELNKKV